MIGLLEKLRTEADAYVYMEQLRWGANGPICPHCDNVGATFIEPLNGVSRRATNGTMTQRRVWRCVECRKQFSVLTGTVFHGTKLSLRIWLLIFFEMVSSKNGVAAAEIQRKYGVHPRTAWHAMHRLREAMKTDALVESMRGAIVADETFIGGKIGNRHVRDREATEPYVPGSRSYYGGKTPVLLLINTTTGEARSRIVADVTGATLHKAISEQVDMAGSTLTTDEASAYIAIGEEFKEYKSVNHAADEYVRYEGGKVITSNQAEGYFSQLKRSLDGTHHHVSVEHLPRYLAEFDFRYSTRKMSDTQRMAKMMGQVGGKRLTYKRLNAGLVKRKPSVPPCLG